MNPQEPANNQSGPACYTAARIAVVLGMSKRGVLYALQGIPASGAVAVAGRAVDGWALSALPAALRKRIEKKLAGHVFRDPEHLFAEAQNPKPLPMPLSEIAPDAVEKAAKLKSALAPSLARRNDMALSEGEFERLGLEDYKRVYGFAVSVRHWRRLFKRTVQRDAGAENFDRLELFLDERPARKDAVRAADLAGRPELSSASCWP